MAKKTFKEFINNASEKEQKEAVSFIKKYTELMSKGSTKEFGLAEQPMSVKEALNTKDASVLVTKVMEGTLEKAAEPMYIGSKFFKKVSIDNSNRVIFPAIGSLRAHVVGEGQEYRNENLDINLKEKSTEVTVTKKGLMVPITEEMVEDSLWSVIGLHVEAAGRSLARLKEELIFKAMSKHGHPVFDNDLRAKNPDAGTTGMDENMNYNDTISVEDMFDLILAIISNEYTPTDVLVHPLTWSVFVKNGLIDIFSKPALGGSDNQIGNINRDASQGRLPVNLNIIASPFIPFDQVNKKFDMYCVDRNNVGVILERDSMTTDQFTDPYKDIHNLKFKERYGIGILDEGKAVATAKSIALDVSYDKPQLVRMIDVTNN